MADNSLQIAINEAAAQIQAETEAKNSLAAAPAETQEETTEETSETSEETTEETPETPAEDDLSAEQAQEAKNLYKALSGPQASAIIAALAAQAGLLPKQTEAPLTKKEETAARREIKTIVAEALGPEYAFLQEKIGKIFDEVVAQQEESVAERFAVIQQNNVEREVVTAYNKLATETKGASKQFENRMAELSAEIPIGTQNVETYMRRLYTIASSERKTSPQKVADQIRRNASDAPARLKSSAGPAKQGTEIPTKKMNLNEAVEWAAAQVQQGKRA